MVDCLLIVERNVFKPDIIHLMLQKTMDDYFKELANTSVDVPGRLFEAPKMSVPNYGMAGTISLTSVVLATSLLRCGLTLSILDDDNILVNYSDSLYKHVQDAKVIAISTTYIVVRKSIARIVEKIREISEEVPIVLGGQGVPALSLNPLSEKDAEIFDKVDAVMYGEAEDVFPELVKDMRDRNVKRQLPGVLYNKRGSWEGTQIPVEVDLNNVPIPDYGIVEKCSINDSSSCIEIRPSSGSLEEGRGCKFRCSFCSYHLYSPFRRKTPERIISELKALKQLGYDSVAFVGAEFINPIRESFKIFEAMREAKLGMNYWIYGRLDLISKYPDLIKTMSDAGVSNLVFGMESGDRNILKRMKKHYDIEEMINGAKLSREKNISITSSVIIGFPGETDETIENTIRVLTECNFYAIFLHALNIVPDTPLWYLKDDYGLKIKKSGYWAHETMALHMVPGIVQKIINSINNTTSSLFVNVKRNIAAGFVRPGEEYSNKKLDFITNILQDILCNEWSEIPNANIRKTLWDKLKVESTQLPFSALDILKAS